MFKQADKLNNPFLIAGYHSPKYFCDRIGETEKIILALKNDRNITLISPRRIGKTGLIHHVFYKLDIEDKDAICIYIDIFSTQNLYDFTTILSKNIFTKIKDTSQLFLMKIQSFFKSCTPVFTFDPITNMPSVSLDIKPDKTELGLQEIFGFLKTMNLRCYIAIDEFQQILEYPEKGVEALLRSQVQFLHNTHFIFAGSKKHLMDEMFLSNNRPFYQSSQKVSLSEIPSESYSQFAIELFKESNKILSYDVFNYLYHSVLGHTWYVQNLLNQLFALSQNEYSITDVDFIIDGILEEENATYKTYCDMLTKGQLKVLTAIAKERILNSPFEINFLKRNNLSAVSSVKLALNALQEKSLILKNDDNAYFIYDRFFSLWLEKRFFSF